MYCVFEPESEWSHRYDGISRGMMPVAWFEVEGDALDFARMRRRDDAGYVCEIAFMPEKYVTGADYVHKVYRDYR